VAAHPIRSLVLLATALSACDAGPAGGPAGGPGDGGPSSSAVAGQAAMLGKADGTDRADRGCAVVLRSVGRTPGGPDWETDCESGVCLYVWRGSVDVGADALAGDLAGATVHVLYRTGSDPGWWEVPAVEVGAGAPGFRRFDFAASAHLFGPGVVAEGVGIELVAFARTPDGARTFDHNRFPGDFDNHVLSQANGFSSNDGGTCEPVSGTLSFFDNWDEHIAGTLRQGGWLEVRYDIDRLPQCRGTHNGHPAWDVVANVRFLPGGQLVTGSVRRLGNANGRPTNDAVDLPFVVRIPEDATSVELWFRNFTGAGSNCEAYDSNLDANYRFEVWPASDHPRCLHVERENGTNTEDPRMVHMQPYCLPYDLAAQADARHCEFHVDGFGDGHMGHYGIPFAWLVAYLRVGATDGDVLNAGMYTRFRDRATGLDGERFSIGMVVSPGVWKTGIAYGVTGFQGVQPVDLEVGSFAFFVDVRRPGGDVIRFWQSRGGANFGLADAFGLPGTKEYIPYGNIVWAADASAVLESRAACR